MTNEYLTGRVQEALAHVGETDVHVAMDGDALVLTGNVATAERHAEVVTLVATEAGDVTVTDRVNVVRAPEPDGHGQEAIR